MDKHTPWKLRERALAERAEQARKGRLIHPATQISVATDPETGRKVYTTKPLRPYTPRKGDGKPTIQGK